MTDNLLAGLAHKAHALSGKDFDVDIGWLERFAALVAAECCKIVYGQCESDNVAYRTAEAIRAAFNEQEQTP